MVDILLEIPRIRDSKDGTCVAYSKNLNDTCGCVHNVNAGVAYFLQKTLDYKIDYRKKECKSLIKGIIKREVNSFIIEDKNWQYWDRKQRLSDNDHTGYQVDAFMNLSKETKKIGYIAGKNIFANSDNTKFNSLNGCMRILPYFPEYSDSLLIDVYNFIENPENTNPRRFAQLAFWSANFYLYLNNK